MNNHTGPVGKLLSPCRQTFFVSAVSGLVLKLIYHRAGTVVHLLLLKFSMIQPLSILITKKQFKYYFLLSGRGLEATSGGGDDLARRQELKKFLKWKIF